MSPRSSVRQFQSVLCPVDFSAHSAAALRYAAAVVRRTEGHLTVVHVEDPWLTAAIAAGHDSRVLAQRTLTELQRLVARAGVSVSDGPPATLERVTGRPVEEILKAARRHGSDLIVMGTLGTSVARKIFFGSTTEQVLRRTSTAVLVVSERQAKIRTAWPARLLGAIELSGSDRGDVRAIADVAQVFDAKLTLVHVVPPTSAPPWMATRLRTHDRQRLADARERLRRLAAGLTGLEVECRVVLGDPGEELPAIAEDAPADLVVLRLRRGHGLFGKKQGSTTYRMISGSTIPMLALPPGR